LAAACSRKDEGKAGSKMAKHAIEVTHRQILDLSAIFYTGRLGRNFQSAGSNPLNLQASLTAAGLNGEFWRLSATTTAPKSKDS